MFTGEYRETVIRGRLRFIMVIIITCFGILLLRVGYLQIMCNSYYVRKSIGNRLHPVRLIPPRGMIYDRYGKVPIVDNETSFDVCIAPDKEDYVWRMDARRKMILDKLGLTPEYISQKLAESRGRVYEPVVVKENVDTYTAAFIGENNSHVPEFIVRARPSRKYEKIAAHIIGYTGSANEEDIQNGYAMNDLIGKSGLEAEYEKYLRGGLGWRMVEVNTFGQVVRELPLPTSAEPGGNLYLTLDSNLQKKAEEVMVDKTGVLLAIDPRDGGILAMVSKPDFDPDIFLGGGSSEERLRVMKEPDKPMLNRAVMGEYPPGSTFKIISATAALAEGKITENTYFTCRGSVYVGNRSFKCHKAGGHGTVSIREALAKSCNVFFYNTAYRAGLSVPLIHKYADMYGLGKKTGIDLPGERKGNIPLESRYRTDNVNMVIGQGAVLATPLQMANVISVLANRGFSYKPHLVDYSKMQTSFRRATEEQNRLISNDESETDTQNGQKDNKPEIFVDLRDKVPVEIIDLIRTSLVGVAKSGLNLDADLKNIQTCGKTGTAQNPHGKPHAWYMGFAPYENPRIVVVALIENVGFGSENAAPIAGQLLSYFFYGDTKSEKVSVARF
jgi:penicillin-binding protein 2